MQQQFFRKLFIDPTAKPLIQFFRYVFVGGCSFLVDAGVLWLCVQMGLYYLIAACFSFIAGLICNYFLSRALVFRAHGGNGRATIDPLRGKAPYRH